MEEVLKFVMTFKEFPPRSFPQSFNPATIVEETIDDIRGGGTAMADRDDGSSF